MILFYLKEKIEHASVCFCFIWEVSNPACTMTYTTITHLEKLKYTHLYKLDTTFQNISMSYEPPPPPTFRQLSHLTLLKRNLLSRDPALLQRLWLRTTLLLFRADDPPHESELGFRPEVNVCVGLGSTFLKTTQVFSLTSNSLCCPPSLSWHLSMEMRSQVQQQQEKMRQRPGQPVEYPLPQDWNTATPMQSCKHCWNRLAYCTRINKKVYLQGSKWKVYIN